VGGQEKSNPFKEDSRGGFHKEAFALSKRIPCDVMFFSENRIPKWVIAYT